MDQKKTKKRRKTGKLFRKINKTHFQMRVLPFITYMKNCHRYTSTAFFIFGHSMWEQDSKVVFGRTPNTEIRYHV